MSTCIKNFRVLKFINGEKPSSVICMLFPDKSADFFCYSWKQTEIENCVINIKDVV